MWIWNFETFVSKPTPLVLALVSVSTAQTVTSTGYASAIIALSCSLRRPWPTGLVRKVF
jgi:hypothetical protein